ncbi:DUF397 domain-containing protein [Nocardia sp. BSTN01]
MHDSKNSTGPALIFSPAERDSFTTGLQDGKFQRPA